MRISSLELFHRGLESMLTQQKLLSDLQYGISTGKRITKPSDDPVGATRVLNLRQNHAMLEQFSRNAQSSKSSLEAEESALQAITTLYQSIRELAIQANTDALNNTDRQAIATEMQTRLNELYGLVNSKNTDGESMFAGSKGKSQTVVMNELGQYIYQGDESQRFSKLAPSTLIAASDSGKELLYTIPSSTLKLTASQGMSTVTTANSGLVPSGSLSILTTNNLILNQQPIQASVSDGVSTSDSSGSALAIAASINANNSEHGVIAHAETNTVNLGIPTLGILTSGDFSINGVSIVDPTGSEASMLAVITSVSGQTGVTVSQPGGSGTAFILHARDGRNIQLQSDGVSVATFANFDLNSGVQNSVARASVTIRDQKAISIAGSNPSVVGLNAGVQALSINAGTGAISQPIVTSPTVDTSKSYSVLFNADGTYSVLNNSDPSNVIAGYDHVPYLPDQNIEVEGLRFKISGSPASGDVFHIQIDKPSTQDVFTTIQNLIATVKQSGFDPALRSYEIGIALTNLTESEIRALEVRAKVGARMNVIDSQLNVNESLSILTQASISSIEDLDITKAISELTQKQIALQAAQQSYVRIQSLSLFNFLR